MVFCMVIHRSENGHQVHFALERKIHFQIICVKGFDVKLMARDLKSVLLTLGLTGHPQRKEMLIWFSAAPQLIYSVNPCKCSSEL